MKPFLIYLLESGICLMVFYAGYMFFLQKDTFFSRNRFYLLFSLLLGMLIPLIRFNLLPAHPIKENIDAAIPNFYLFMDDPSQEGEAITTVPVLTGWTVLAIIYAIGIIICIARIIYSIWMVQKFYKGENWEEFGRLKVNFRDSNLPHFSMFRKIYINRLFLQDGGKPLEYILLHEQAHISQMHWLDLLLLETVTVLQWFNPAIWLIRKEVKDVHEYLADEKVLQSGCSKVEYQRLLVNQTLGLQVFNLTNSFNQSNLKKRMLMINKNRSNWPAGLKVLAAVPILLVLLLFMSNTKSNLPVLQREIKASGQVLNATTNRPLDGAAIVMVGSTTGTISNKEGQFELKVPEDSKLNISFVGYKSVQVNAQEKFLTIRMEEEIVNLGQMPNDAMKSEQKEKSVDASQDKGDKKYVVVEEMASYPGGLGALREYLAKNIRYPQEAVKNKIEGKVILNFVINEQGHVEEVKVVRSSYAGFNEEAIRVVKSMPQWTPGKQHGKPIKESFTMPVEFKLGKSGTKDQGLKEVKEEKASYLITEEPALFKGGTLDDFKKYVQENIKYPENAIKNGIQGKVIVQFIVDENGSVEKDVQVLRGVSPELDQEAVRVIQSSPKWTPAKQKGQPVRQILTIPVVFALK